MRRLLVYLISGICVSAALAQNGYELKFHIRGLRDTTAYLGYYYWENTYLLDTAKVDNKGNFSFTGAKPLSQGVFILVMDKKSIVEFPVGNEQHFTLETDTSDYVGHMKVTGSMDDELFFQNLVYVSALRKKANPFVTVLKDSTITVDKKKDARESYEKIGEEALSHQLEIINKYPSTLTARLLNASREVKVPDPPKKPDGSIDSTFQLRFYRQHFFDYFNLADEAMIRMPQSLYKEKVLEYLDKLYAPDPDTIMQAISGLVEKAKANKETFKFLVWTCMTKYENPKIMGLDEVFVDLYDKYFASGLMDYWANEKLKSNLKEAANRMRLSLIGNTGPNLILQDGSGKLRSMYDLKNKYVILYIYDPDCGHCRKETPKLVDFVNKTKFDVGVYAVCADSSLTKMKDYTEEMKMQKFTTVCYYYTAVGHYQKLYDAVETPSLFVLDAQHKIIGKKIPSEDLEKFFTEYEIVQQRKLAAHTP